MTKNKIHNDSKEADIQEGFNPVPWIAAALLILGAAVFAGLHQNKTVTIRDVQFKGSHFVTTDELHQQIKIPAGISPDSLNFMDIIRRIENIDYVRHADINIEPSGSLIIQITEREPLALLTNGNSMVYIDRDGIRLPVVLGKPVDVPILYGFETQPLSDTLKSNSFISVRNFLLQMNSRPVANATISEIGWTQKNGIVAMSAENGVKLIFGKSNYETRLRNWEAFYGEIVRSKGIKGMQSVDLRFRGQIVTKET